MQLTTAHQLILAIPGLTPFLLSTSRPNILAANKEGLASLPGYLAIFLVGLSVGEHILVMSTGRRRSEPRRRVPSGNESDDEFSDAESAAERATRRRSELALELAGYAAASWIALGACSWLGARVSRRLVRVPFPSPFPSNQRHFGVVHDGPLYGRLTLRQTRHTSSGQSHITHPTWPDTSG